MFLFSLFHFAPTTQHHKRAKSSSSTNYSKFPSHLIVAASSILERAYERHTLSSHLLKLHMKQFFLKRQQ